jgi:hypothetical protein
MRSGRVRRDCGPCAAQREAARRRRQSRPRFGSGGHRHDDIGESFEHRQVPKGGVWVIAETTDFQTKFRRIVVSDDEGRIDSGSPSGKLSGLGRGYGLVDSSPIQAKPGSTLR